MEKKIAINALIALAHETRLDIFRILVRAGRTGMAAGAVAQALGVPASTLSFHLKELKFSGIVTCCREGRSLIYNANFAAMNSLVGFLTENCCEDEAVAEHDEPTGTNVSKRT